MVIIFSVGLFLILVIFSFWALLPIPKSLSAPLPISSTSGVSPSRVSLKW